MFLLETTLEKATHCLYIVLKWKHHGIIRYDSVVNSFTSRIYVLSNICLTKTFIWNLHYTAKCTRGVTELVTFTKVGTICDPTSYTLLVHTPPDTTFGRYFLDVYFKVRLIIIFEISEGRLFLIYWYIGFFFCKFSPSD